MPDPYRAHITADISIHDAIKAIEHFAEHYPEDRLTEDYARRLVAAGGKIQGRVDAFKEKQAQPPVIERKPELEYLTPSADQTWI